jgi:hypothetical protein
MSPPTNTRMSLTDWEKTLSAYCAHVAHLSEIPLTPFDIDQIGQHLKALLKRTQANQLKDQITRYRSTWVVYMAAIAARNDDLGYWDALAASLGVSGAKLPTTFIGSAFLRAVEQIGLPDYTNVGGYRYVTPIRLHGGIPAYSLPDFFEHVLMPAVRERELADLTPAEQIASILARPTVEFFVDSPVRNYLKYGGKTAIEFFAACTNMARVVLHTHDLPSSQTLGLPSYVVAAFQDFMEARLQVTQGQKRLRAPRLLLDPYSSVELFRLELPAEPVDADRSTWRHHWTISLAEGASSAHPQIERVRVRRIGYDQTTEPRTVALDFPPGQVRIEFWATAPEEDEATKPELIGRWAVSLVPALGQAPLLAFRAPVGQSVRTDLTLPAERLWLLYPRWVQIGLIGNGRCTQQFSELIGNWSDWQIEEWDLSDATALVLESKHNAEWRFAIRGQTQEPRLEGGERLSEVNNAEDAPFYVGEPPHLRLPRLLDLATADELKMWRVTVSSRWAAYPALPEAAPRPLADWAQHVTVKEDGVVFPLAAILGTKPMGLYTVAIEGPHKMRSTMRLYVWPEVALRDWRPHYLPGPQGAEPVVFSITVPHEHRVVVQPGTEGIEVKLDGDANCYKITVAPNSSEAPLFLEAPQPGGEPIRLALHVRVARLRWKLTTEDRGGEWSTTPIRLPVDGLVQSQSSYLTLELDADVWPACKLMLNDASINDDSLQEGDWHKPQHGQQRLHIRLAEYTDTLRRLTDCPIFGFALRVSGNELDARLPLLYLNRNLEVTAVLLDWTPDGVTRLHWEARHRLRNRRVRLWSAWQPWTQPHEFSIPDEVATTELSEEPGSGKFELPISLPRGWYWISLRTAPAWEQLAAPPEPTVGVLLAQDVDADWRLLELEADNTPGNIYANHFERACIYATQKVDHHLAQEIQWLNAHWADADPGHLFALWKWLMTRDAATARAVRIRMYAPEKLREVLTNEAFTALRGQYLEGFTATKAIKPESALLVLDSRLHPQIENHALTVLMKRRQPRSVTHLVETVAQGGMSERDALALLQLDAEFAVRELRSQPNSPVQARMILALLPLVPSIQLVALGDWVHTEAGWGRIDKILADGVERQWFDPEADTPHLKVLLRPGQNETQISVMLDTKTIAFPQRLTLYQCAKESGCNGFVSTWLDDVTYQHNRSSHLGIGTAYRTLSTNTWRYRSQPTYSRQRPADPFA